MMTRKPARYLLIAAAWLAPTCVLAGQFSFGGGETMSSESNTTIEGSRGLSMDVVPAASRLPDGGETSLPFTRAGVADASRDEASPRDIDNDPVSAPTTAASPAPRTAIPVATPAVPNRARSGNRWQSLVPGAIK